jgi:uncharacterized protein YjcR
VDWNVIKTEYITNESSSYRKLAEKYGVSYATIGEKARQEGWVEERKRFLNKTLTKTLNAISKGQADRASRLVSVADKLLTKIENAVDNFDMAELLVDKQALKQLTGALKDIKDIQMIKSEIDLKEQEARIAKLQKEAEGEEKDTKIEVIIGDGGEDFSS